MTRTYESNGPDVKIRGTAAHIADKYVQLARDAQASGDPVAAENYFQHAEHYYRILAAAQPPYQQTPGFVRADQDDLTPDGYDDEEEGAEGSFEGGPMPLDAPQPYVGGPSGELNGEPREGRGPRENRNDRFRDRDNREFRGQQRGEGGEYRQPRFDNGGEREFRGPRNEGEGQGREFRRDRDFRRDRFRDGDQPRRDGDQPRRDGDQPRAEGYGQREPRQDGFQPREPRGEREPRPEGFQPQGERAEGEGFREGREYRRDRFRRGRDRDRDYAPREEETGPGLPAFITGGGAPAPAAEPVREAAPAPAPAPEPAPAPVAAAPAAAAEPEAEAPKPRRRRTTKKDAAAAAEPADATPGE